MASENRKRNSRKQGGDSQSLWGFLFKKQKPTNDMTHGTLFDAAAGMEDADATALSGAKGILKEIWARMNVWILTALILFVTFVGSLFILTWRMWQPQDLSDIAGYKDNVASRDLDLLINTKTAAREEIVITEAEINRYLRDNTRIHQDGIFSIITHANGVAIRVHDGYAELIIERIIGADFRQTTSVHLHFYQKEENGKVELCLEYRGGDPVLMGSTPRGGSIGKMGIPQRHIVMLQPALETLRDCHPGIRDAILKNNYCPYFEKGRIVLRPFSQQHTDSTQQ